MSDGELKKRMFTYVKTVCVHSPEVDEKGEVVDQYIHPSSRPTTDEEKKQILDEAKKDLKKRLKNTSQTMLESYIDWDEYWL